MLNDTSNGRKYENPIIENDSTTNVIIISFHGFVAQNMFK